jgi:hypothetical protein
MRLTVLVVLLAIGCAPVLRSQNIHTVSRSLADPTERSLVWARALEYFPAAAMPIELSDPDGGILVSKDINNEFQCRSLGRCQCYGSTQFTIAADGTAMISRNCVVSAPTFDSKPLIPATETHRFRDAQDYALRVIVGDKPPVSPAQRGAAKPGQKCAVDADCTEGYRCPDQVCVPEIQRH